MMKNVIHQFMDSLGPRDHVFTGGAVNADTAAYAVCSSTKVMVTQLPVATKEDDTDLLAMESNLDMYDTEPRPSHLLKYSFGARNTK